MSTLVVFKTNEMRFIRICSWCYFKIKLSETKKASNFFGRLSQIYCILKWHSNDIGSFTWILDLKLCCFSLDNVKVPILFISNCRSYCIIFVEIFRKSCRYVFTSIHCLIFLNKVYLANYD